MTETFSSPYNFVPLSEHIVFPDWADRVSHDIPFSDGLDGEISFRVETVSDIFIRNGSSERNSSDTDFFNVDNGLYCIPSTSIKGMVRNVMEIASFGKLQHVTDKRYAIRDLQLKSYTSKFTNNDLSSKVQAGFLDISNEDWKIIPCKYALWLRSKLDPSFGNKRMSAADKYKAFYIDKHLTLKRNAVLNYIEKDSDGKNIIPHYEANFVENGGEEGVLVFTGQPQDYKPQDNDINDKKRKNNIKNHEFFFYSPSEKESFYIDGNPDNLEYDEYGKKIYPIKNEFLFIYTEQSQSKDFDNWTKPDKWHKYDYMKEIRKNFYHNRIPIFYINENGHLRIGLSQLFRFAGEVSIPEAIRNTRKEHYPLKNELFRPDMADLVFGYSTPKSSLRGRVQFSVCIADEGAKVKDEMNLILSSPKPTFYPAYVKQPDFLKDKNEYKTFLDKDAELRGWKRYPAIGSQKIRQDTYANNENQNMYVRIKPLSKGTIFHGKVRFHNLREVELGALLWALQMMNPKDYCHSIGMAKPYGLGKIKVIIESINNIPQEELFQYINKLMIKFQDYTIMMLAQDGLSENEQKKGYINQPQIQSLLGMAFYKEELIDKHKGEFSYLGSPKNYSNVKGNLQKNEPSCVLMPFYTEQELRKEVESHKKLEEAKARANIKISPEEQKVLDFVSQFKGSISIKDCIKVVKKCGNYFTDDQIKRIMTCYKSQKSNPTYKELYTILLEHRKQ